MLNREAATCWSGLSGTRVGEEQEWRRLDNQRHLCCLSPSESFLSSKESYSSTVKSPTLLLTLLLCFRGHQKATRPLESELTSLSKCRNMVVHCQEGQARGSCRHLYTGDTGTEHVLRLKWGPVKQVKCAASRPQVLGLVTKTRSKKLSSQSWQIRKEETSSGGGEVGEVSFWDRSVSISKYHFQKWL